MHATTATAPPLSPAASPGQPVSTSPGIGPLPIQRPRRRVKRPFAWLNAVAAAVLLLGLAAGWYFSGFGPGGTGDDDGHLAALPAMQTGTPAATPTGDITSCLADNGLVYRAPALADGHFWQLLATSVDGEDRVVGPDNAMAFASGQDDLAISIGPETVVAMELTTGTTTQLGVTGHDFSQTIQFGPWIVAPANADRTDWLVTYLPTMDHASVTAALPDVEVTAYSVTPKVSADGTTLALVVTPDNIDASGSKNAHPVAPTVFIVESAAPEALRQLRVADPDLAQHADLVAVSPDGSLVSAPTVGGTGTGDLYLELDVWSVESLTTATPTVVALPPLDYPVREGFAFFSPEGSTLNYLVDGTVNTLRIEDVDQPIQTSTYDGALYGALLAPGGEGALVGVRGGSAESPSAWLWIDGITGKPQSIETLDHFMFTNMHPMDDTPVVAVAPLAELTASSGDSGPSIVFFDVAAGTVQSEMRDIGGDRVGGISGYELVAASNGSLVITRFDDEAFFKAHHSATGERWQIPVPDGVPTIRLSAVPSPNGDCIAVFDEGAFARDEPQPIWVVAARPNAEPVLVAEGWFSNWYETPTLFGR